jgi:predicted flavoprotein YhiN
MRAYLPISHKDLEGFVLNKSFMADELYAPTIHFVVENPDCDEEELEYLLSVAAGEEALENRLSEKAPGIVIAFEIEREQIAEHHAQSITLTSPLKWDQVQCALLAFQGDDELVWFATQEIDLHLAEWK